jgi:CRP-like cAMP-binding protein
MAPRECKKNGAFALNLLNLISDHAHEAELEAEHQASMSSTQLVACFLQRLCMLYEFDPHGFDLPYNKTLIASRLGMELETLSRTFSKLREYGITVSGSRVTIHNHDHSGKHVCSSCSIAEDCPTHRALQEKIRVSQTTA